MRRKIPIERTIRGVIFPSDLDDDLDFTGIGIETADGEEYSIFLDRIGEEMMSFVEHQVEATGTVKEMHGELIFTVNSYSLLDTNAMNA